MGETGTPVVGAAVVSVSGQMVVVDSRVAQTVEKEGLGAAETVAGVVAAGTEADELSSGQMVVVTSSVTTTVDGVEVGAAVVSVSGQMVVVISSITLTVPEAEVVVSAPEPAGAAIPN
jgi:hypothetical protein